jgi:hypothetical protein
MGHPFWKHILPKMHISRAMSPLDCQHLQCKPLILIINDYLLYAYSAIYFQKMWMSHSVYKTPIDTFLLEQELLAQHPLILCS